MNKGGAKGNPMDEIKKIEQKREERRAKMEQAKREKEEKKAYNLASGKNVDIDFEIMIEKSKFREKMLSPHTPGTELKVVLFLFSYQSVFERGQYLKKRNKTEKSILLAVPIPKSKSTSLSTKLME